MQKKDPILIHVPHAATYIPKEELQYFVTPNLERELMVMTDHFTDDLFDADCEILRFPISRLVCDPERFRDDEKEIMAKRGMGAVYTSCSDCNELRRIPDEHKEEILLKYYDRHHRMFEEAVTGKLEEYGCCLIIDGHSFYPSPLPYEMDQGEYRPDICIGTDAYHTPAWLACFICHYFQKHGYETDLNRPFSGAIVPEKYYNRERRVISIMIEINRGLYMCGNDKDEEGYRRVKKDIAGLIAGLRKMHPFFLI